ncbi:hypothetical protein [Anaeromicropila herbilytica]|uniref:Uncharacterized protein n=1 Tax=Anaeromicropila herbilytica TaxID=2785025 RepID=A0A7R7ENE6_9FIRM|nr:hypothetical protein [Anaeromicropila herbilytica]BCN32081.1 hypothetical protein bsdtb5_33760 [Anaeromicropila herbilytica]
MNKNTGIILAVASFFAGMVCGFFIAPMKQGIGNNSGNNYNYYDKKEEEEIKKDIEEN